MSFLGDLGSLPRRKRAEHALNRAKKHEKKFKIRQAGLARRQFLRTFRGALATNITQQNVNAGGLDSSAFRGTQQSLLTQKQTGVAESLIGGEINQRIDFENETARISLGIAENFQTFGDTAMAIAGST